MPEHGLWFALLLGVYAALALAAAWRRGRPVASDSDYFLCERELGVLPLVGTLLATFVGAAAVFDQGELAYRRGVDAFVPALLAPLALLLVGLGAARLRSSGRATLPALLEARFGALPRVLGALLLQAAYLLVVAGLYRAGASLVGPLSPWLEGGTGMVATALLVVATATLGGLRSVVRSDLVGLATVIAALLAVIAWLVATEGGAGDVLAALPAGSRELTLSGSAAAALLGSGVLIALTDASLFQRIAAARDRATARRAVLLSAGLLAPLLAAFVLVALFAAARVADGSLPHPRSSRLLPLLALRGTPPWLGALLLAGLFATLVTTANSLLLAQVSSLGLDLHRRFLRPGLREDKYLFFARLATIACGLLAIAPALLPEEAFERTLLGLPLYAAALAPSVLAARWWPRATRRGAVASIAAGALGTLAWSWLVRTAVQDDLQASDWTWLADLSRQAARLEVGPLLPGFGAGVLALVVGSLSGPPPSEEDASALEPPQREPGPDDAGAGGDGGDASST